MSITASEMESQMTQMGIMTLVIINKSGKVIDSFGEGNLNISKEKKEMLFIQTALQCSMQDEQDDDFGKTQFLLTKRDKSKFVYKQVGKDRIAVAIATNLSDDIAVIQYVDNLKKVYEQADSGVNT
jgi:hypothetical protein